MIEHKARNKAGRAWIAAILDAVTRIDKIEIDNITDVRTTQVWAVTGSADARVKLLRGFIEMDGRDAVLFEIADTEFVYLTSGTSGRYVTKYVIQTYAFDVSDLPEMERTKP